MVLSCLKPAMNIPFLYSELRNNEVLAPKSSLKMFKRIYLLFLVLVGLTSISMIIKPSKVYDGVWEVQTVLIGVDTLYQKGSMLHTAKTISSYHGNYEKTEDDLEYEMRCIRSTYNNFKQVRLEIHDQEYSLGRIMPCWDHLSFPRIDDGVCLQDEQRVLLYDRDKTILMVLDSKGSKDQLLFTNKEHEQTIVFHRMLEE